MNTPVCYFLIGAPGSGKSTWTREHLRQEPGAIVLSTDQYIEDRAAALGKTYGQVFQDEIKPATRAMNDAAAQAVKNRQNIIWDQTNMSVRSRAAKLDLLRDYNVVAIVFEVELAELTRRIDARREATGKDIPHHVLKSMLDNFEPPSPDEGFVEIFYV